MKKLTLPIVLVLALAGCKQTPAPAPPSPSEPATPVSQSGGGVQPPGGGDIGVDPTGWTQAGVALSVTQTNDVWIPTGFTGSMSEIKFKSGATSSNTSSVQINFPSGAALKVTPGSPASWQCQSIGSVSFGACTTQDGTSIPSSLSPSANGTNATITLANGVSVILGANTGLTFK